MFQLVAFKIHAIIKTVYCFNWLPWTFTGSSHWEVFLEINLIQKTLKFYTSWVHWKNQCRSTVRKHALLWNKHEYQHYVDTFVKNIFNPFHGFGHFLYFLKYIRKAEVSWCFPGALTQVKSFLQNEIINFPHLILMTNLSPITLIKLLLFFLTLLVVFSSSLKHA